MVVAKKDTVGKRDNLADTKFTSRINGNSKKGAAQVLVVLDGKETNGKRKRILDTLKRLQRSKNKTAAVTFKPKQQQEKGTLMKSSEQSCCTRQANVADEYVLKTALCAARLTPRFAEIISIAKAEKADVDQGKKRLVQKQGKEEETLKEAEQLKKKEAELRQKEREAARVALQMMESTVDLEDNLMIVKELEQLSQCSSSYIVRGCNGPAVMVLRGLKTGKVLHPIEQLGLHLKEEFMAADDDEDAYLSHREVEEGEIVEY